MEPDIGPKTVFAKLPTESCTMFTLIFQGHLRKKSWQNPPPARLDTHAFRVCALIVKLARWSGDAKTNY